MAASMHLKLKNEGVHIPKDITERYIELTVVVSKIKRRNCGNGYKSNTPKSRQRYLDRRKAMRDLFLYGL